MRGNIRTGRIARPIEVREQGVTGRPKRRAAQRDLRLAKLAPGP
jgi:hypothetical protein